jgi:alkaline phosphatase D
MRSKNLLFFVITFLVFNSFAQIPKSIVPEPCMKPFYHGVASGDALHDRVIIWTRVSPTAADQQPALVTWKVALDTSMTQIVQTGSLLTTIERDYTVKIDVQDLQPDTWYYYEFYAEGKASIQGRTRTTPNPTAMKDSLRFAVVSCANLEAGFFNVYGALNQRKDFDAVICLGDYLYEYETGGYAPNPQSDRFFEPSNEIITLEDYRMRHSIYRLDGDLRRLHQNFPWFFVWDDHEFANDAWTGGAQNHTTATEGNWMTRKDFAKQAYFEWIPIRDNNSQGLFEIYRNVSYGQLVDLILLDTRVKGRNEQLTAANPLVNSSTRTILGTQQHDWLINQLDSSAAIYKVIAQQIMVAPLEVFGVAVNMDQWDGYPAERSQILDHIVSQNIENVVVLTGDIHTSWASNLPTANGNAGVEFVTPSVTSPALEALSSVSFIGEVAIKAANPHIKWVDLTKRGYMIVDINENRVQSDWFFINTIDGINTTNYWANSFYSLQGTSNLLNTSTVSQARNEIYNDVPQLCPRQADLANLESSKNENIIVFGLYPNPTKDLLNVHFSNLIASQLKIEIVNALGQKVKSDLFDCQSGSWNYSILIDDLQSGVYTLKINSPTHTIFKNFIKE